MGRTVVKGAKLSIDKPDGSRVEVTQIEAFGPDAVKAATAAMLAFSNACGAAATAIPAFTREPCLNPKCVDGRIPGTRPGILSSGDRRRNGKCPTCDGDGYIVVRQ